jgi:hypothetical protein
MAEGIDVKKLDAVLMQVDQTHEQLFSEGGMRDILLHVQSIVPAAEVIDALGQRLEQVEDALRTFQPVVIQPRRWWGLILVGTMGFLLGAGVILASWRALMPPMKPPGVTQPQSPLAPPAPQSPARKAK